MTPRSKPPTKVNGMDRRPPITAAADATIMMEMYPEVEMAPMMGAATTPARAARTLPITHAYRDVLASFTPRIRARLCRSTTARICRPNGVRRMRNHRPTAQTAALMTTTNSFEVMGMWGGMCQVFWGTGPSPAGKPTWRTVVLEGMLTWKTSMIPSMIHSVSAGMAKRSPTVAMILADSLARARGLNTATSNRMPSSGAKPPMTKSAAHTMGQCNPVWKM